MSLIENEANRDMAYFKAKKCILKKAMEISICCAQSVFLVMYDKERSKIILYRTSADFDK